jgi:hypothetical protein
MPVFKVHKLGCPMYYVGESGWQVAVSDEEYDEDLAGFKAGKTKYEAAKHAVDELRRLADELERKFGRSQ